MLDSSYDTTDICWVFGTLSYKDVNKEPILVNQSNEHNSGKQDTAQEMPWSRNHGTRIRN